MRIDHSSCYIARHWVLWTGNYTSECSIRIKSCRKESIISLVDCAQRKRESKDIYCKINTFNVELRYRAHRIEVKYDRDAILSLWNFRTINYHRSFANKYTVCSWTCVRGNRMFYDSASNKLLSRESLSIMNVRHVKSSSRCVAR